MSEHETLAAIHDQNGFGEPEEEKTEACGHLSANLKMYEGEHDREELCSFCVEIEIERSRVTGEWLNMVARVLGPIPCGGNSITIAERHIRACCKPTEPAHE